MPQLTYSSGYFRLICSPSINEKLVDTVSADDAWELDENGNCVTSDFKAARQCEHLADEKARKILKRAFVTRYKAPPLTTLPLYLDPHQKEGVSWILSRARSYLAHAPGAGKTCESITAAHYTPGPEQVLFIVPPSLTENWYRETKKWLKQLGFEPPTIAIIPESDERQYMNWFADFLICPDSMLTKEWVLSKLLTISFKFVAVDEASRFKEPSAQRTIALFGGKLKDGRRSSGLVFKPRHSVLLDGSPMPNRPMELWAPTYAMNPEAIDFMSQRDFGFRYCGAKQNKLGQWEFLGATREAELHKKLTKEFMHVVGEESLGHPERLRSLLYMDKDPRSVRARTWEKNYLHTHRNTLAAFLSNVAERESQIMGDLARFRRLNGEAKVKWVASYVKDRLENKNEQILVFAWHREVCEMLEHQLRAYRPGLIMGGVDGATREHVFRSFQEGKTRVIIGNIVAMGRGHNLQRASRVVFAEYSWTDELNKQCEKRASRKGSQHENVRCDYVVLPDSLDERVLDALFRKEENVRKVIK